MLTTAPSYRSLPLTTSHKVRCLSLTARGFPLVESKNRTLKLAVQMALITDAQHAVLEHREGRLDGVGGDIAPKRIPSGRSL